MEGEARDEFLVWEGATVMYRQKHTLYPGITEQAHTTKRSGIVALLDSDIRMIIEADVASFKKKGDKNTIKDAELEGHKVK